MKLKNILLLLAVIMTAVNLGAIEIVIPDEPGQLVFPPKEGYNYAAKFLQDYIQRATGIAVPIVKESATNSARRRIFVGNSGVAKKQAFKCNPEELIIQPVGKDLLICGEVTPEGVDRGTLFGVYEYLEQEFGVRWFYPAYQGWSAYGDGTIVPKKNEITFPKTAIRSTPRFIQREGGVMYERYYGIEVEKLWHPILRFGSTLTRENANHTQIGWTDLYGKEHPEYFARSSSGRSRINWRHKTRTYLCLSSEGALKQMMANLAALDEGKDPGKAWGPRKPTKDWVYFACNDGMVPENTCHCPECSAMLEMNRPYEGRGSELFFRYATKYARLIQEKYPQRQLAVLAYSHYLAPPKKSQVPSNMHITYVGPRIHYAADPEIYEQHKRYIDKWSELLGKDRNRMTFWFNIVSPTQYTSAAPFMYPNTFKKFLKDNEDKAVGFFINGFSPYLRRLGEVRIYGSIMTFPMAWIQSRLMWNPDADVEELLQDYCQNSYGKGADDMLKFYHLVIQRWEGMYQSNKSMSELDYIHHIRYPKAVVAQLKAHLNNALKAAQEDADRAPARRIRYLLNHVYSKFFEESAKYSRIAGTTPTYDVLPVEKAPVIDGQATEEDWANAAPISLVRFQWGAETPRQTEIRMLYDAENLYLLAELKNVPGAERDELRIQYPSVANGLRRKFAPNIDKEWKFFHEIRVCQDGKVVEYGRFPQYEVKVVKKADKWVIEGKIARKYLTLGVYSQMIRLQFLRYTGVWNDYDVWTPSLGGISDYPTWRFGLLNLLPAEKKINDGLE